jgi:NAD(P)-dependent dehydrogenase (short-subunit alcohol dehydrogenase family)
LKFTNTLDQFEYITQLSSNPSNTIFALVRSPTSSTKLNTLAASNKNVHVVQGDITSIEQLKKAAEEIGKVTGGGLDVLVNNAVYGETETAGLTPSSLSSPENLAKVINSFNKSIETNVLGAIYGTSSPFPSPFTR